MAQHPCPFAMLYYRAVIPLGDDHGYTALFYFILLCLDSGAEGTGGTIVVDLGSRQSHDKVGSAPRVPASDSLCRSDRAGGDHPERGGPGPGRRPRLLNNNALTRFGYLI